MSENVIKAFSFNQNSFVPLNSYNDICKSLSENNKPLTWIIINDPNSDEFIEVAKILNIHPLSLEDCKDENYIPKIDIFENYIFILLNLFNINHTSNEISVDEVDFMLSNKFLITVYKSNEFNKEFFNKLIENILKSNKTFYKSPDFLLYTIIDFLLEYNFNILSYLEDNLESLEQTLHLSSDSLIKKFHPDQLISLRKNFLLLRKSIFYQREVLIKLCRHDVPFIKQDNVYYFRDILDTLTKFFEFVEVDREMISNIFEIYLSIKNNQLSEISLQTNEVMKRLTLITTIFMPLTLISSIGGMSEYTAITGGTENWLISYTLFLVAMIIIGWLSYALIKWKKWV